MTESCASYPRRVLTDFAVGATLKRHFLITPEDLERFVSASGDAHPLHTDPCFAQQRGYPDVVVHGMCVASRCSAFIAEDLVGSHGLLVSISADFRAPVQCDQSLQWMATVVTVEPAAKTVEIRWTVANEQGVTVQRGTACAWLGSDA